MLKLLLYIGILIGLCYIIDYFYLKSKEKFKEAIQAYKEFKKSKEDLEEFLK